MTLMLDSAIRDWVLVPVVAVMFLMGLLKHHVARLVRGDTKGDLKGAQASQALTRAKLLRANANFLPSAAFRGRKHFFNGKDVGFFHGGPKEGGAPQNPLSSMQDPSMMMDMMKRNALLLPNLLLMPWVSHFFSGFVVGKIPFPLTQRFRGMLQRGVELQTLDVSYVSALSLYFLTLFGLRGVFSLILGQENAGDETKLMQQQMNPLAASPLGGGSGPAKMFQAAREDLELTHHTFALDDVEQRLINKGL